MQPHAHVTDRTFVLAIAALALSTAAYAEFTPNVKPTLEVRPARGAVRVDGVLGDPGWQGAAHATNFAEVSPGDQTEPPVQTDVWVTYDESNFYLAVKAQDDPRVLRASLRDRDRIFQDDFVGIMIDTYGNASWAYEIFVNAMGVQGDLRMTTRGEDMSFDLVFESQSSIANDGFVVEVAIPFRSLRFPDKPEQRWRVQFWRTHPRDSRRQYAWAAVDRDDPCFMCQFGTLTGIRDVRPGGKLDLLPSITTKQVGALQSSTDPRADFENGSVDGDAELTARYSFTSSISADLTINPDFSQVEADAGQIDVNTTFALFFPERRPFFQEGSDLYDTWISAVYTRTINDPTVAGKLTGRLASSSLGFFSARDERSPLMVPLEESTRFATNAGRSTSNVGRFRHDLGDNSHIGLLATNRVFDDGGSNSVFGGDAQYRFLRTHQIEAQWLASYTDELDAPGLLGTSETFDGGRYTVEQDGESFWGQAGYVSVERQARTWRWDVDYWVTSPTFRADNGFVFQNNSHRAVAWSALSFRPDTQWFDQIFPNISAGRVWNFDGIRKDEWLRPEIYVQFKGQTDLWTAFLWSEENFGGVELKGIRRWQGGANSRFSEIIQGGVFAQVGKLVARQQRVLGDVVGVELWSEIKPMSRLVIEPTFDYLKLDDPDGNELFSGYILRTRTSYQFTRELFLRLVVQYDDFGRRFDIDPLLTYKINPFTMFFVGSTHDIRRIGDHNNSIPFEYTQTERQFFAKFQYLFQI